MAGMSSAHRIGRPARGRCTGLRWHAAVSQDTSSRLSRCAELCGVAAEPAFGVPHPFLADVVEPRCGRRAWGSHQVLPLRQKCKTPLAGRLTFLAERGGLFGTSLCRTLRRCRRARLRRSASAPGGCSRTPLRSKSMGFSSGPPSPPEMQNAPCGASHISGGEGGIRTPGAL
jgi:hypothetical protein